MKFILYSILFLVAPCNSMKKASSSEQKNSNMDVTITYDCGACFGGCPVYKLIISGENKMATFVGTKYTKKIGTYTKAITDDELQTLVNAFEKAKFNSLQDEYMGIITDMPIKTITYTRNGNTKKIRERSNVPEAITTLEKQITVFADSEGWKKNEDPATH